MHIAFVDSNPAALDAIKCAKEEGHRVSYIQSYDPIYPASQHNQELINHADWIKNGVATTDPDAVRAATTVAFSPAVSCSVAARTGVLVAADPALRTSRV